MPDIPTPITPAHNAIRREDYRPPDWLVPEIALEFELDPDRTRVRATLGVTRNGSHDRPLRLDGDELIPLEVMVDGGEASWSMDGPTLVVMIDGDSATVETLVELAPAANSKLTGLYASGGLLCTQCESEGFRRITFFPDRPDVLSRYRVRMSADTARFPVLLANGNHGRQRRGRRHALGRVGRSLPQALLSVRVGRRRPRRQPRQLHHHVGPQGRSRHLGARGRSAQDRARHGQPEGGDGLGRAGLWPRI